MGDLGKRGVANFFEKICGDACSILTSRLVEATCTPIDYPMQGCGAGKPSSGASCLIKT